MRRCARSGYAADQPALLAAQTWIEAKGGLRNVRVFTRYWLALIGEWPWEKTPNLPPEVIWLPLWFPFNIYNFAQWARATLVPIARALRAPAEPAAAAGAPARRAVSRAGATHSITTCRRRRTPAAGTLFFRSDRQDPARACRSSATGMG